MVQVINTLDSAEEANNVGDTPTMSDDTENNARKKAIRLAQEVILSDDEISGVLKDSTDQFIRHIGASLNATKETSGIEYQGKTYAPVALIFSMIRNSVYRGILQTRHPKDKGTNKPTKRQPKT